MDAAPATTKNGTPRAKSKGGAPQATPRDQKAAGAALQPVKNTTYREGDRSLSKAEKRRQKRAAAAAAKVTDDGSGNVPCGVAHILGMAGVDDQ